MSAPDTRRRVLDPSVLALATRAARGATRARPRELEHAEQVALFAWARATEPSIPELALLFAIPNGGHRHKATAGKLKAAGVKPGVPDVCLPVPRRGWAGLFIELKAPGGRASAAQADWMERLARWGNRAVVCEGWEAARDAIMRYLSDTTPTPAPEAARRR